MANIFSASAKSIKSAKRHVINLICYLPPLMEAYRFAAALADILATGPRVKAEAALVAAWVKKPGAMQLLANS